MGDPHTPKRVFIGGYEFSWSCNAAVRRSGDFFQDLFQMFVDRLRHLKHIQFFGTEDGLELVVREDLPFILRVLQLVLFDVCPNLFGNLGSRQGLCADNLREIFRMLHRLHKTAVLRSVFCGFSWALFPPFAASGVTVIDFGTWGIRCVLAIGIWRGVLALVIWSYYIGVRVSGLVH